MKALVARVSVVIEAPRQTVWATLVAPDTITKITPVSEVVAPWRPSAAFVWGFEMLGERTLVEGAVRRFDENRALEYDFVDPHTRDLLHREHLHRVSSELFDEGAATRVTVTQDGNIGSAAHAHAEGGWRLALNHLKRLIEA